MEKWGFNNKTPKWGFNKNPKNMYSEKLKFKLKIFLFCFNFFKKFFIVHKNEWNNW